MKFLCQATMAPRVLTLASLTAHTGNRVTAERISRAISPDDCCFFLDVASVASAAALAEELRERRVELVLGIHAYRAGRLLLGCGVPFVVVLGGTDMNEHLRDREKAPVIRAAIEEARRPPRAQPACGRSCGHTPRLQNENCLIV